MVSRVVDTSAVSWRASHVIGDSFGCSVAEVAAKALRVRRRVSKQRSAAVVVATAPLRKGMRELSRQTPACRQAFP